METKIFDGRTFGQQKINILAKKVERLIKKGIQPKLASIYLAADEGSVLYTNLKKAKAELISIGFEAFEVKSKDKEKIISIIKKLNKDNKVQGILVQKPSGENDFEKEEWQEIVSSLNPQKDVDGLTPENFSLLGSNKAKFIPATVKAVLEVLNNAQVNYQKDYFVILGASEILGKPLNIILKKMGANVSLLDKNTLNIKSYTQKADVLISATGCPALIGKDDIKENSVIIDVGAPKGDVITSEVVGKARFLSPVPGGVGPMTISCLLENLVESISN
jgi:methylenetetrahydrofolate dehydrogenase (NADP+)/methenyltetrahydrofolate cyclohydrolase